MFVLLCIADHTQTCSEYSMILAQAVAHVISDAATHTPYDTESLTNRNQSFCMNPTEFIITVRNTFIHAADARTAVTLMRAQSAPDLITYAQGAVRQSTAGAQDAGTPMTSLATGPFAPDAPNAPDATDATEPNAEPDPFAPDATDDTTKRNSNKKNKKKRKKKHKPASEEEFDEDLRLAERDGAREQFNNIMNSPGYAWVSNFPLEDIFELWFNDCRRDIRRVCNVLYGSCSLVGVSDEQLLKCSSASNARGSAD